MKVRLPKIHIFQMDFNDFMKHWNRIGVTLGTLWGHFGSLGVTWGSLWSLWGHFGVTLGSPWGHFGHLRVALGHFLVTFDVENDVDVHRWWLGGFESRKR